ncbi:MAG: glycoside hydrolase family 65 protein, partial [Candidatus Dormibacteria bacterium]
TIDSPGGAQTSTVASGDLARTTVAVRLEPGQRLRVTKLVAYGWSSQRTFPALRAQVEGALAGARQRGWEGLLADQRDYLDSFWDRADVEITGDSELQQAVRFALFHLLQAGARAERRAIPAKGLTGPGYDGHTFWDTEMFVLPVLTYTVPDAAADALRWRHSTLQLARERAGVLDLKGAAFPWRTIRGQECSGYWPASTAAVHVNADIAHAVTRYSIASCDEQFDREVGVEMLVETARLWRSLGHYDLEGGFRIDGVTGPDEYSALANNNLYTNLMAQSNLQDAADAAERYPDVAGSLGVTAEELAGWRSAAGAVVVAYDDVQGVHQQAAGFTRLQEWDFAGTPPSEYPLLLHFPYFELYRKQVVKQADLVLAMHVRGDAFTPAEKARNFDYYERLTVRDSSLSACTQSVVAAEVGHLDLAYDYAREAALMDLDDLEHNVSDGLHMASLAGAWIATVAGFGGFRDHSETICFAPRLPPRLSAITFRMIFRGRRLRVAIGRDTTTYQLAGVPMEVVHHGQPVMLTADRDVALANPSPPRRAAATQPAGREPRRRS